MSSLYDFSKNAWHVKFFKWMWNVDPTIRYKTMCPYFWQYVGSIIILPFIAIWKLLTWLWAPIDRMIDSYFQASIERSINQLREDIMNAETDEDCYKLYRSKCYQKHYKSVEKIALKNNESEESFWDKYHGLYYAMDRYRTNLKYGKTQAVKDKLQYGIVGKVIGSIIIAGLLFLVGWGVYEILHLFTMEQFIKFLKVCGATIVILGVLGAVVYGGVELIKKIACNSWVHSIRFWTPIGNGIVWFVMLIANGIKMTINMIKNFYKNQCPVIHWKNEE